MNFLTKVSLGLVMFAQALPSIAQPSEDEVQESTPLELSFFEYIGWMVEEEGTWLDPLDLDSPASERLPEPEGEMQP